MPKIRELKRRYVDFRFVRLDEIRRFKFAIPHAWVVTAQDVHYFNETKRAEFDSLEAAEVRFEEVVRELAIDKLSRVLGIAE